MSKLFRKIDFGGFISWNTQPNCRVFDDLHPKGPWFNSWRVSRITTDCPVLSWLLSRFTTGCHVRSCRFFNMATTLWSSLCLDLLLGCSSTWRCENEHFSPNLQPLLVLWNKHSGGCHFSQNELVQVPLMWSLQGHRDNLPLGLFPLGLRVLDAFRSFCCMKEWDGFGWWTFPTLIDIVTETALVSYTARWTPIANNLQEFFVHVVVPWFLTTAFFS